MADGHRADAVLSDPVVVTRVLVMVGLRLQSGDILRVPAPSCPLLRAQQ